MNVPDYPCPAYPTPARGRADNPGRRHPFADTALTTGLRDATLTGQPYPLTGWFTYATNLLQALPNEDETVRAIQRLDLMVVVDVVPSEMAAWADVVLPEAVYLERYDDLNVETFREPFVALRQPVVAAPADQKPNWWIARELALRLGLRAYFPWTDVTQYLDHRLKGAGLSLDRLQEKGIVHGDPAPLYFADGVPATFGTPSGKIEFYSVQLRDAGLDPVPRYTPVEEPPPGAFRLLFGRAPMHTFARTQTNPLLLELMDENEVWVNADVARRLGLASGTVVRLRNQDGVLSEPVKVKATERIRGDCVYLVHGFGHRARGLHPRSRKGASDARLVTRYRRDPLMGGTAMNVNFVTIEMAV